MKLKTKRLCAALLSGVLATGLLLNGLPPAEAAVEINDAGTYEYNSSDPLYAATHFHFFGEEYVEIRAHCHGNVATDVFSAGCNSGSNKLGADVKNEIFYFRQADDSSGFIADFAGATVVVGAETSTYVLNGAEVNIQLTSGNYKRVEPNSTIYQEASVSNRYIDLEQEFKNLRNLSANLPYVSGSEGVVIKKDSANYELDLSNQTTTTAYININAADMAGINEFKITNVDDFTSGEAVVINYMIPEGTTDYTMPFTKIIMTDKNGTLNSQENWGIYQGHGNILWNFYTIKDGKPAVYEGTVRTCPLLKGTVLAPAASIRLDSSNQDGNFIGKRVYGGGGETHRWDFGGYLPRFDLEDEDPTGALEVIITEAVSNTPIKDATVVVTSDNGFKETYTTDANGKLIVPSTDGSTTNVITDLEYGKYTATVTVVPDGYKLPEAKSAEIVTAATVQIPFVLEKEVEEETPVEETGSLRVYVSDSKTSEPVANVTVTVKDPEGNTVASLTSGSDGYTDVVTGLTIYTDPADVYTIITNSVPSDYKKPADVTQTVPNTTLQTVPLYVEQKVVEVTGSIQATITDEKYNDPISGAEVQIIDKDGTIIQTLITDSEGKTGVASNLPINQTYTVKVVSIPDGTTPSDHEHPLPSSKTATPTDSTLVVVPFLTSPVPSGSLEVIVTDEKTGEPIEGATVVVESTDGTYATTLTTDEKGCTDVVDQLPVGNTYTVKVTAVPEGYNLPSSTSQKIEVESPTYEVPVVVSRQTGSLQSSLVDESNDNAPIEGATIKVVDEDGTVVATLTTDSEGKTTVVSNLYANDTYTVKVTDIPNGENDVEYPIPQDKTATIVADTTTQVPFVTTLPPYGALKVLVTDKNTGEVIPGATVQVSTSDGVVVSTLTTKTDGYTDVIEKLIFNHTYVVEVTDVPDGYTGPDEPKDVLIELASPAVNEEELQVIQSGLLQGTIVDEKTGEEISGATVIIKDSIGTTIYTGETDEAGKTPVIKDLTIGETYTIITQTVPSGYNKPADATAEITGNTLKEVTLLVSKETGSLQATIIDRVTHEPIPDAEVTITDSKGNIVHQGNTNSNGQTPVIPGLTVNESYTIHTNQDTVPDGYTAPSDATITITKPSPTTTITLQISPTIPDEPTTSETETTTSTEEEETTTSTEEEETTTSTEEEETTTSTEEEETTTSTEEEETTTSTEEEETTTSTEEEETTTSTEEEEPTTTENEEPSTETPDEPEEKETGSLQATIIDETTKEFIPNAEIIITDSTGKEIYKGTTNGSGQTDVIKDLTIDETYTIHTEKVPEGYNPPSDTKVTITTPNDITSVILQVKPAPSTDTPEPEVETGSLQATIIDEISKEPIPNAEIIITDSTGKEVYKGTTNGSGQTDIISGLPVDETYTIHTEKVPEGYNPPSDVDVTITDTDTVTSVTLQVKPSTPATGSLQTVITDKNTGAAIKDATVEIKDEKGNVIATVKTDNAGMTPIISGLVIGTTYTAHVVEVPSGYTAPDDKATLISNASLHTVKLVVSKTADSNVNTGDSTDVFTLGLIGFMSLAALIGLSSKRKES